MNTTTVDAMLRMLMAFLPCTLKTTCLG